MVLKVVGEIVVDKMKLEVKTEPQAGDDDEDEIPLVSEAVIPLHLSSANIIGHTSEY